LVYSLSYLPSPHEEIPPLGGVSERGGIISIYYVGVRRGLIEVFLIEVFMGCSNEVFK